MIIKLCSKGFTLSELLLATAIMAFVLVALLGLFIDCMLLGNVDRSTNVAYDGLQTYLDNTVENTAFASLDGLNNTTFTLTGFTATTGVGRVYVTPGSIDTVNTRQVRVVACFMCGNRLIGNSIANCSTSPVEIATMISDIQ